MITITAKLKLVCARCKKKCTKTVKTVCRDFKNGSSATHKEAVAAAKAKKHYCKYGCWMHLLLKERNLGHDEAI